jgi:hypothetical protein
VRYTGNTAPLTTCRRMAELLCNTFGEEAGKRDIIKSSPQITDYPATTAKNSAEMEGGEHVTCKLTSPVHAWALRVVDKPASGENPQQTSSSCAEVQAFSE